MVVELHNLKPASGKKKRRRGRGTGSGYGNKSGSGDKGQLSRSGGNRPPGFEGGQTPLVRRLPKRGFTNIFRREYAVVNVEDLNRFPEDSIISPASLMAAGLIKKNEQQRLKILGRGELDKRLTVKAHAFSRGATEKINACGGQVEVI